MICKLGKLTMIGFLCVFAGACSLPVPKALAQDALWRSYYTAAQKEYQHSNYGEAESLLREALSAATENDESLSAYFYLAHICVKRERYDEATQCYKILLDGLGTKSWAVLRPPDGTPDWEQSAEAVEEATERTAFGALLKKKPPRILQLKLAKPITIVDVLSDYGTLMQLTNRPEDAEKAFRQALVLSDCRPDQAAGYEVKLLQKLSLIYASQGRAAEQEAVNQQLQVARNTLLPDFDEVIANTIKGLNRFGHDPRAQAVRLNNLALFCATHGDYAKAQALFNRAMSCLNEQPNRHKKDRAVIMSNYSDLLLAMGQFSEGTNLNRQAASLAEVSDQHSTPQPNKSTGN